MASPLEYLLLMMMSTPGTGDLPANVAHIEPASGDAKAEVLVVDRNGSLHMRTILMEPRDTAAEKLEAPVRITPEWVPSFKIGSKVDVMIDETGKTYAAKVNRIESITDASGQSVQVILEMNKAKEALQPGMTGTATLSTIQ